MFIEHSKCGSRLTSSVLPVNPRGYTHPGTARRFPHLQHAMYCTDSDAFDPFSASFSPDLAAKTVGAPPSAPVPPFCDPVPLAPPPRADGFAVNSAERDGVDCFDPAKFDGERAKSSP